MIPTDSRAADISWHGWHDKRDQHFPCAGCMLVHAHIYQVPLGMRTGALISRGLDKGFLLTRVFADGSVLNSMLQ